MTDTAESIRERLQVLHPENVELFDERAQHAGHAGAAGGGGHYRLVIVAKQFSGLNAVARHRLVYQTLGDLMHVRVHALAITALTPEEL